jgi:hypothetical protein
MGQQDCLIPVPHLKPKNPAAICNAGFHANKKLGGGSAKFFKTLI